MHGSRTPAPRFPRRRTRGGALVGVALIGAGVLAGCGASVTGPSGDGGGDGGTGGAPQVVIDKAATTYTTKPASGPISSFSWDLPYGEPTGLDPIKSYGDSENTVLANVCESLQRQNPNFSLSPGLATYRRASPTRLVYTIRKGVRFSDGHPLTTQDVAYSLNRNMNKKLASYWAQPFYNNVRSITATSPTEVTVALKRPDALFDRMMSTAAGAIGEEAYIKQAGSSYGTAKGGLMCTGPYTLKSWQPGSQLTLQANPHYWDHTLKPKAKSVTFQFVTDESTLASALTSGEIDGTFEAPAGAIPELRQASGGTLTFGAGTQFFAFRPTQRKGPLDNPKIRQALSDAIDRNSIAKVIFQGAAVPSVTPVDPGAWGYARSIYEHGYGSLPKPVFNPRKARALVKEAGSPKQPITVATPADQQVYLRATQDLQSAAKRIGITIKVAALSTSVFNNLYYDAKARSAYDAFAVEEYGAGVAEPIVSLSEFTPLSAYDYGKLQDPGVTDNIRKAQSAYGDAARARDVVAAQAALVKTNGAISVAGVLNSVYQGPKITGAPASLSFLYFPWAAEVGAR